MNPSNSNQISHIIHRTQSFHSSADLQRLLKRRSYPISMEFCMEETNRINKAPFKKLLNFTSKRTLKLCKPPIRQISASGSHSRHLRSLQVSPEDAEKYIAKISRNLSKLTHFAILDEQDSFVPMRIKQKVHPMRHLKSFIYDHEFCRDFMKCARYVNNLKIRKTSLDLNQLKRLQNLQNLHLIIKTRYLSLPEEDVRLASDLGKILDKLPFMKNVVLEQDVDPETSPYTFMELQKALKDNARVHLIADFIDVSNQRNKSLTVERMFQTIKDYGISSLKVNYVGVAQPINRFGRSFYAPLHIKPDLYVRFLNQVMTTPFKAVEIMPIVHSSYIDFEVRDTIINVVAKNAHLNVPKVSLIYDLDMIELNNMELMANIYSKQVKSYDINITNKINLKKGLSEKLEEHFSKAFAQILQSQAAISLDIVTKNLNTLGELTQIIAPLVKPLLVKNLNIQIIEPISSDILPNILELMDKSGFSSTTKELLIDFTQRENPREESILNFVSQASRNMHKMTLSYHNTGECEAVIKGTFEKLRLQNSRTRFQYEINNDRAVPE